MKTIVTVLCAILCITLFSCHRHDSSITYRDSDHYYIMKAHFNKSKTRKVENYLEENLGGHVSFVNNKLDDILTINGQDKFYIQKTASHINIKLDKRTTSREAYYRVRSMCEGMKDILN